MKSNRNIIISLGIMLIILLISLLIIYKKNNIENFDAASTNKVMATLTSSVPLSDIEFANKLTAQVASLNCKVNTTDISTVLGNIFTQKKSDLNDFKNFYNKFIIGYSGIPEFENYMLNNKDFLKDYAMNNKADYLKKYFVAYINTINPNTSKITKCADIPYTNAPLSATTAAVSFIDLFASYIKTQNGNNTYDGIIYYSR
jgi:hypothetical protein